MDHLGSCHKREELEQVEERLKERLRCGRGLGALCRKVGLRGGEEGVVGQEKRVCSEREQEGGHTGATTTYKIISSTSP